jgi:hypothetical protein
MLVPQLAQLGRVYRIEIRSALWGEAEALDAGSGRELLTQLGPDAWFFAATHGAIIGP